MLLAHHHIDFAGPGAVVLTEPAVAIPLRVLNPILFPQQVQRHALAFEFAVNVRPVGNTTLARRHGWTRRIQLPLERRLVELIGEWPTQPRGPRTLQVLTDRGPSDAAALGDLSLAVAGCAQAQDFFYLPHRQPRCWHRHPSLLWKRGTVAAGCPASESLPENASAGWPAWPGIGGRLHME